MKRPFHWLLPLLLAATPAGAEVTAIDDTGRRVSLPAPAHRIVSLAPHLSELLFAAGAGPRLVGAVEFSDYPPAAREVPRVGGYEGLDLERVLALQPDLVVAWESGNGPRAIERLRALGLTLYISEPRQLKTIPETLEKLGRLAGTAPQADAAANAFRRQLALLTERYRDRRRVSVFYQVWHRPLMTVGGEHLISRLIELCGGYNVFGEMKDLAPSIGTEAVLAADPEVILASGSDTSHSDWLTQWRRWPQLAAVRRGQLHFVPPDLVQRPTPRLLQGAGRICEALQTARDAP